METKVLDPLDGVWLRTALGYLLAVVPRDGDAARVVFTRTDEGQPLLVAHDQARCHYVYAPVNSVCLARGGAPRRQVRALHRMLGAIDKVDAPKVEISPNGRVRIERGGGQPSMSHDLDMGAVGVGWEPPSKRTRAKVSTLPVALDSTHLQRSVRWPDAAVEVTPLASGIVAVSIREGAELVARAWIAEPRDSLYPRPDDGATSNPFPAVRLAPPANPEN